jgi:hypothetical protein
LREKSYTQEESIIFINNICKEKDYTLLENFIYITRKTKNIHLNCNKDDYVWVTNFDNLLRKNFCKNVQDIHHQHKKKQMKL